MRTQIKQGYVLMVVVLILTILTMLVSSFVVRTTTYQGLARVLDARKRAYILAWSGLEIARAQLAHAHDKESQEPQDKQVDNERQQSEAPNSGSQQASADSQRVLLETLLPIINRWQTFTLREKDDGIDAVIKICVTCEDGKFNLNQLYNFKEKRFAFADAQAEQVSQLLQEVLLKGQDVIKAPDNLFQSFEDFLRERGIELNDPTELVTLKPWYIFDPLLFYQPPSSDDSQARKIYLCDLFTLWSDKKTIQPWLLSDSMRAVLDLPRVNTDQISKEQAQEWAARYKKNMNWPTDWAELFEPIYQKDFNSLPKGIELLLETKFDPQVFGIICRASYRDITVRLYAIMQRSAAPDSDTGKPSFEIKIKKIYWV